MGAVLAVPVQYCDRTTDAVRKFENSSYNETSHSFFLCNELRELAEEKAEDPWNTTNETADRAVDLINDEPPPPSETLPEHPQTSPTSTGTETDALASQPAPVATPPPSEAGQEQSTEPEEISPPQQAPPDASQEPLRALASDPPKVSQQGWTDKQAIAATAAMTAAGLLLAIPSIFYNRLTKDRVDTNQARARVWASVCQHPGSRPTEIARRLMVDAKTVVHHLRVLLRFGRVVVHHDGTGPRYFENHGRFPEGLRRAITCLRRPGTQPLLTAINGQDARRLTDIARQANLPLSTVGYRANQLLRAGLLERQERRWRVTDQGRQLLAAHPPMAPSS